MTKWDVKRPLSAMQAILFEGPIILQLHWRNQQQYTFFKGQQNYNIKKMKSQLMNEDTCDHEIHPNE